MSQVLRVMRYTIVRMLRDIPSLVILLAMPLALIPILGAVFSWIPKDIPYMRGVPSPMAFFSFGILVMFQLFGGSYSLTYVKNSLLGPLRWRLLGLPCGPGTLVLGIVAASTFFSVCQGLVVVGLTTAFLGVAWGNLLLVLAILLAVSLLSQLVYLSLLLGVGNQGAAMSLGWFYAYGSCILGGLIVPLPVEKPFFHLLASYGGPYSLAQTALRQALPGGSGSVLLLCLAILYFAALCFGLLAGYLGRRRLA